MNLDQSEHASDRLKAMLNWAHRRAISLRLIEPGKPNQNADVESFNEQFRDECLNEHGFMSQAHARAVVDAWRREYDIERLKRSPGGAGQLGLPTARNRQFQWGPSRWDGAPH